MSELPNFLITRFAPGAAGNMISSLLQCSPEVAHWDHEEQQRKPQNNWLGYFQKTFQPRLDRWLYHEPIGRLNWGTREIFSAKYPRGNDITADEFLRMEKIYCDPYYHEQKNSNRYLPVFWHKNIMPEYFSRSRCLIIRLDDDSIRWFNRAVYHKHYQIMRTGKKEILVRNLENRPEIVLKQFQDQAPFEESWPSFRVFVGDKILNNPYRTMYQRVESFDPWPIPSKIINLSMILAQDKIYRCYQELCAHFEITPVLSKDCVETLQQYWRGLHAF